MARNGAFYNLEGSEGHIIFYGSQISQQLPLTHALY